MRESLGTRLRQQREAQHVAIASIAKATKVSGSLFAGLERDDVSGWPSGIYRRSFIRSYAEAVRLDPDAVCREFAEQFPDSPGPSTAHIPVSSPMAAHLGEWQRMLANRKDAIETVSDLIDEARLPKGPSVRWQAAAWDVCGLLVFAACALAIAGRFWIPLGVVTLCYHLGGTLLLGKSPTLWWFERRASDEALAGAPNLGHAPLP